MTAKLSSEIRGWCGILMDLVYPRHCHSCEDWMDHAIQGYLCAACATRIRYPAPFTGAQNAGTLTVHAICVYEGVVRNLLTAFKFHKAAHLAGTLCAIVSRGAERLEWSSIDAVVPVPLHRTKLKERGYNQSLILAHAAAKSGSVPVLSRCLIRRRYSAGQTLMDRKRRLEKIRGSFQAVEPRSVAGLDILLVDDVLTTGATVHECARVLKRSGARSVTVLVLARTL